MDQSQDTIGIISVEAFCFGTKGDENPPCGHGVNTRCMRFGVCPYLTTVPISKEDSVLEVSIAAFLARKFRKIVSDLYFQVSWWIHSLIPNKDKEELLDILSQIAVKVSNPLDDEIRKEQLKKLKFEAWQFSSNILAEEERRILMSDLGFCHIEQPSRDSE